MDSATTIAPLILAVPPWEADKAWRLAEPLLAPSIALTRGAYEPPDVLAAIKAGEGHLWVALTDNEILGAVASRLIAYPRKRSLYCPFVGGVEGRLSEWWEPMFARLEEYARRESCDFVEGAGRDGWSRTLPGMKRVGSLLIKEL